MGTQPDLCGFGTVTYMATKKVKAAGRVLPPVKTSRRTSKSSKLRSVDDLLSTGQRRELRADLDRMARIRRDAEATSGALRLS